MLDVGHRLRSPATTTRAAPVATCARGVQHGLQAGPAAPVDLEARHPGAEAGVERGDPADRRRLAVGVALAEDDVVDIALAEAGAADELGQDARWPGRRRSAGERAARTGPPGFGSVRR